MKPDPRLLDPTLLVLAGLRRRRRGPPMQEMVLRVVYENALDGSTEEGPVYRYTMPRDQLAREWRRGAP